MVHRAGQAQPTPTLPQPPREEYIAKSVALLISKISFIFHVFTWTLTRDLKEGADSLDEVSAGARFALPDNKGIPSPLMQGS